MRARSGFILTATIAVTAILGINISQAATSSPSSSPTAQPTTTVTLVVKGCEGCTIGVQRGLSNEPASTITPSKPDDWNGPKTLVKAGIATLALPTAYTSGSSFTVSAPWEGLTDGVTNIVLGGRTAVSTNISVRQATHRKLATACWAGTQDSHAIIRVTVIKRKMAGMDNKPTAFPIAWASPTVATVGPLSKTLGKGLLGNQDMYFC
ncbi:MAG: hypothetical protein Q7L55_00260 [Actinomycetota bacterium]|nr:hypothetical protein [Actinomycetota bacterium]